MKLENAPFASPYTTLDLDPEAYKVLFENPDRKDYEPQKPKVQTGEHPVETVTRFSETWNGKDFESLVAEFISVAKETNREPDTYHFELRDSQIIDPNTNRPILDFIAEGVEKNVARKLEDWAANNEEGMALWVSPKMEGIYPCPKVIMHKIAYLLDGTKVILNTVILFDAEIDNPKYKRETLYTLPDSDSNIAKILGWIKRKSHQEINLESTEKTSVHKARYFARQVVMGVPHQLIIDQMQEDGFLGENSISCPGEKSLSGLIGANSDLYIYSGEDQYGSLEFKCPSCKAINTRPVGQLLSNCQFCQASVRC